MTEIRLDPINRQASKVFDKGEQVDMKVHSTYVHSREPLPIVTDSRLLASLGDFNLTGFKRGRLTVIGKARDVRKRWVVRCSCGNYEMRRTGALMGDYYSIEKARCEECRIPLKSKTAEARDENTSLLKPSNEK